MWSAKSRFGVAPRRAPRAPSPRAVRFGLSLLIALLGAAAALALSVSLTSATTATGLHDVRALVRSAVAERITSAVAPAFGR
jgi:hypothetical protein